MNAPVKSVVAQPGLPGRRAYDPNNLHPDDAEARRYDDTSEGIDWDEIIATTQDDWVQRKFSYSSDEHPDEDASGAALARHLKSILERVLRREEASRSKVNATGG